jgi:predicted phage gp36 major capsid-like protein
MLNKNRELLKKIYREEYEKALKKEKSASLGREIDRIRRLAREKARRKAGSKMERMRKMAGGVKRHRKSVRRMGDAATRIQNNLLDLL